ncbi:hypothetical protein LCGC14_2243770, partial [marine sediment metagenome]
LRFNIQKMCSVSAGIASATFSKKWFPRDSGIAIFDSRVFNIPKDEVCNYFIWRQQDWTRNSVHMVARSHFSHKELHGKSVQDMHEMLHGVGGASWNEYEARWKNGTFMEGNSFSTPIFTQNREAIGKYLAQE